MNEYFDIFKELIADHMKEQGLTEKEIHHKIYLQDAKRKAVELYRNAKAFRQYLAENDLWNDAVYGSLDEEQ